jgi:hypothetical protein
LPELPRLLHQSLQRAGGESDSALLLALVNEQRRAHRRLSALILVASGFFAGALAVLGWMRWAPA